MRKFNTSFNGYDKKEVNQFVANVTQEYESILNKLKVKDTEIESLKNQLEKYKNIEATLNKTILLAEDTSNQIKRLAREESKTIMEEAKRNASRIVNDALIKAEKYEQDGEELRKRVVNFKRRIRQSIETEAEHIEDITEDY